jgi:outer membrane protein OmpA-like peptidoglycan-associated protein
MRLTIRALLPVAALVLVSGLTACGGGVHASPPSAATAFVVGQRSNMPAPVPTGRAFEAMNDAVDREAEVSVIVPDGAPEVVASTRLVITGANPVARDNSRQANLARIAEAITSARARDEEAELLAALSLAERSVRSVVGTRTIVVLDSGLSTTGPLDFTQPGLLDAVPTEVVDLLRAAKALPDLTGITVVWHGLGDVHDPQEGLRIAERDNLVAIWKAVLEAAGAEPVVIEEKPLSGAAPSGLPWVTPVVPPDPVVCQESEVVLRGGDVAFQPDSAAFRDPAAARAVLEPIAAQIIDGDLTATVTGTTARVGPDQGQRDLSSARARAVADVLSELGVPPAALTVEGLGSNFPGYVPDLGVNGELLPGPAAENRKVIITLTKGELVCR